MGMAAILSGAGSGINEARMARVAEETALRDHQIKIAQLRATVDDNTQKARAAAIKDAKDRLTNQVGDLGARVSEAFELLAKAAPGSMPTDPVNVMTKAREAISRMVELQNQQLGPGALSDQEFQDLFAGKVKSSFQTLEQNAQAAAAEKIAAMEAVAGRPLSEDERQAVGVGAKVEKMRSQDAAGQPVELTALLGPDGRVMKVISAGPITQPQTIIDQRGQDVFDAEVGKKLAALATGGEKAAQKLASVNRIGQLLEAYEAAGADTGALSNLAVQLGNFLNDAGLKDLAKNLGVGADRTAIGQALQGATRQLIGGLIGTDEGAILPANLFTEADREVVLSTVPQITDTPQGFRIKALVYKKVAERTQQIADRIWQLRSSGKSTNEIFAQISREFSDPSRGMFTPEEVEQINTAPKGPRATESRVIDYNDLVKAQQGQQGTKVAR